MSCGEGLILRLMFNVLGGNFLFVVIVVISVLFGLNIMSFFLWNVFF